jgi:hypothetical protein
MLKRKTGKGLCFFLLAAAFGPLSCEKKAVWTGGTDAAKTEKASESEKMAPIVEGPYLNEDNVVVNAPVPGIIPVNPYKDVIQNNINLDDLESVLRIYNWDIGFEHSVIDFKADGKYSLGHEMRDGPFAIGDYEVNGNTVLMRYPYEIQDGGGAGDFYGPKVLDWLFDEKKNSVLVYDKTYKSYSVVTCLRYGDKILKNYALISPYGQEYEYGDIAVIKCDERESSVKIKENLKMRKRPDVSANTVTLSRIVDWDPLDPKFVTGNIVYVGDVFSFDAKTVKTDTIDGITAPWYRIWVDLNEIEAVGIWVFGGYVQEISQNKWDIMMSGDYYKTSVQRLMDNGAIVK